MPFTDKSDFFRRMIDSFEFEICRKTHSKTERIELKFNKKIHHLGFTTGVKQDVFHQ